MTRRPCAVCLRPTRTGRCVDHPDPRRSNEWRTRAAATVREHRAKHGDWCPGFLVPGHAATDLTADHVVPLARGGLGRVIAVLCRSCNGRKKARRVYPGGPTGRSPFTFRDPRLIRAPHGYRDPFMPPKESTDE